MNNMVNWASVGLALDLIGFWLILWDLLPKYRIDKKRRRIAVVQSEIEQIKLDGLKLLDFQNLQIDKIIANLENRGLDVEFWSTVKSNRRPHKAGFWDQKQVKIDASIDNELLILVDELKRAAADYAAQDAKRLSAIVKYMKETGVDYKHWSILHERTYKYKRALKPEFWTKVIDLLSTQDKELQNLLARIEHSFIRSPIYLGAFLVSLGFIFQFVGSIVKS